MFHAHAAASGALAAVLAAVAFGAGGGGELGRSTATEIALLLACGGALAALTIRRPPWPLRGGLAVGALAVLAILTLLSVSWSIDPARSLEEGGRTLAYLAVFAIAVAAGNAFAEAASRLTTAILLAGLLICVWALTTRMLPAELAGELFGGRLGAPFGYWNALGSMAAIAIPPALWAASARDDARAAGVLAYPALGLLLLTMVLTQSRGALAAAAVAAVLWIAIVPGRLRALAALLASGLAAAPVAGWALSKPAFTGTLEPLSAREAIAGELAALVLVMCALLLVIGVAVHAVRTRLALSVSLRRRGGLLVAAVAVLAVGAGIAVAATGERSIADRVSEVTSEDSAPPSGAGRFGSASSSRAGYWREAREAFEDRPAVGNGAGSFRLARLQHRRIDNVAGHAHGWIPQTMTDLGIAGLVATLALLLAWIPAAFRGAGLRVRAGPRPEWTPESTAAIALLLSALAFGIQSSLDWIWFVPGPAVAALAAAGCVAGRHGGRAPSERAAVPRRARVAAAIGIGVVVVAGAWAIWQPERGARAVDRATELVGAGRPGEALEEASRARDISPYATQPLYALARAEVAAGRRLTALRTLERAVIEHPRDPEAWERLATFELETLDLPDRTLETVTRGLQRADPRSTRALRLIARARGRQEVP